MDTKQYVSSLQKLGNSYLDAYMRGAQRYLDLFSGLNKSQASQQLDPNRAQQRYTDYLRHEGPRLIKQLADAGLNYYTVLLNTGLEASNRFFDEVLQTKPAQESGKTTPASRQALLFRGKPGESPSNAFRVSNNREQPVDVGFTLTGIVSEDGKERLQPDARFEPANPRLEPGSEQVVVCTLPLPDSIRQNSVYRGQIHVTGFPAMAIDITVRVNEVEKTAVSAKREPARRKTASKAGSRKTRAKETTTRKAKR